MELSRYYFLSPDLELVGLRAIRKTKGFLKLGLSWNIWDVWFAWIADGRSRETQTYTLEVIHEER